MRKKGFADIDQFSIVELQVICKGALAPRTFAFLLLYIDLEDNDDCNIDNSSLKFKQNNEKMHNTIIPFSL